MLFKNLPENSFFVTKSGLNTRKQDVQGRSEEVSVYQKRKSGTIGVNSQNTKYNAVSTSDGQTTPFREDAEIIPLKLFATPASLR